MIRDLGIVPPGTTLYLPFHTFDSNDPTASVTLTGLATTDIEIYKDGGTTQRGSDNGYALLDTDGIDFDGITGIHALSIDLSDNSTAGFYAAGSQYWVVVSSVTVDAATVNFILCTFRIGYPDACLNTTIATLSTQTSFTLTAGPAEDDALNGSVVLIHDVASAVQKGFAVVSDYTGASKTVTLTAGTTFTAAATDNISFYPPVNAGWGGAVAYSTTRGLSGTALPNAAAEAAGGLYTRGTGAGQINQPANGLIDVNVENWNTTAVPAEHTAGYPIVTIKDGTGTGEINTNAGAIALVDLVTTTTTATNLTNLPAITANWLTAAGTAADFGTEVGAAVLAALGTGTWATAIPWNASWDAEVQSEVQDAIEVNHLDHFIAVADPGGVVANSSFLAKLVSKSATPAFSSYDNTTDSLEANRDNIGTVGASLIFGSGALANVTTWTVAITGNITGNLSGSVGSVTGAVGSVTGAVGSVTGSVGGNVTGSVGSLATQAKADVNAEVLDVLNTDTFAQPGQESPAATTTLQKMLAYLYKAWRNKTTQTSSEYALYADDGSTKDQEAAVSDDGTTTTRGEVQTGA